MGKAYLSLGGRYASVTDDRGAFTFANIKPGTYALTAEHTGYLDGEYGEADGAGVELKLEPGQSLTDIDVKLMPQAVISGRVVDEDGEVWTHAFVNLRGSRRVRGQWKLEDTGSEQLNDQGEFRIGRIPPGKYYLSAQPEASWEARYQLPPPRRQPTWYPNSLDLEGATPIIVGPGSQITGLEIRIRRGSVHRISGTLAGIENIPFPDGPEPYARRRISAESIGAAGNGTRSVINPDGSFEILGVPSGTYDLRVTQGFPSVNLGSEKVQVEDRDLDDVTIQLTPPQRLTGTIRFAEEGSTKLSGFTVELDPLRPARNSSTVSHADGTFEFPLLGAERYRVNVVDNGLYVKEIRYGDVCRRWHHNGDRRGRQSAIGVEYARSPCERKHGYNLGPSCADSDGRSGRSSTRPSLIRPVHFSSATCRREPTSCTPSEARRTACGKTPAS